MAQAQQRCRRSTSTRTPPGISTWTPLPPATASSTLVNDLYVFHQGRAKPGKMSVNNPRQICRTLPIAHGRQKALMLLANVEIDFILMQRAGSFSCARLPLHRIGINCPISASTTFTVIFLALPVSIQENMNWFRRYSSRLPPQQAAECLKDMQSFWARQNAHSLRTERRY